MKFVHASAQLISVLLLTQHTLPFVHGVPSATFISTENEDCDHAVSNTILFSISCKNWIQERSCQLYLNYPAFSHWILDAKQYYYHPNHWHIHSYSPFASHPQAPRGTTPTDSFTDNIVLSGSTAVRSALRATGKDQQEDQKKGYLSKLMSSFDNPSLHDFRNKGILPSDEAISVADEKDDHTVSLLFLSFFQSRKIWLSLRSSILLSSLFKQPVIIYCTIYFHWHLFYLSQYLSQSTFNTIS